MAAYNARFEGMATQDLLRALLTGDLKDHIAAVSSFGAESAVLLHMIAAIDRDVPVIFTNTQKMFGETLAYRDELSERLGFTEAMCSDHLAPWSRRQSESDFAFAWLGAALATTGMRLGVVTAPGQRYHPVISAQAIATLDLQENFDPRLVGTFYTGSFTCFLIGMLAAHYLFKRDWEDAVAIGFIALF